MENNVISRRFAQDVKKQIEITGCKILGVIINKYDIYRKGKYKSYYSGYYKRKKYKGYGRYGRYGEYGTYGTYGKPSGK